MKLNKLKAVHSTTKLGRLSPLTPLPNPKYKNANTVQIIALGVKLLKKSHLLLLGEISSSDKNITPHSCTSKVCELWREAKESNHTHYLTSDEYQAIINDFKLTT